MNTTLAASVSAHLLSVDALDRAIVDLSTRINAATYELVMLVRQFDERGGFLKWGFESCADWLHWRCELSPNAAREKVRVAHALKELPQVSREFASGRLSYSKVRALTRVATRENEGALLAYAMKTTAARLEERCRQMRNVQPDNVAEADRTHRQRSLRVFRDGERGVLTMTVELPIEQGEIVCRALDKAIQDDPSNGPEFADTSWHAQQADALVTLARSYLSGSSGERAGGSDAYQIFVHVDRSAMSEGVGRSDLPLETVKRLSCDAGIVNIVDGADGQPLSVGRKQRTAPVAIKRALWARDGGCAFPGCTHTRFVDAHHVRHWSQGGETSLANTMLLCTAHHRLVHEGGYTIRRDEHDRWYFRRPDGRAIPVHGYLPGDMRADDDDEDVSAETRVPRVSGRGCDGVCETRVEYRAGLIEHTHFFFAGAHSKSSAPFGRHSAGHPFWRQ